MLQEKLLQEDPATDAIDDQTHSGENQESIGESDRVGTSTERTIRKK
jgi:hypothetical protein